MLSRRSSVYDSGGGQTRGICHLVLGLTITAFTSLVAAIASMLKILSHIKGPSPEDIWYSIFTVGSIGYPVCVLLYIAIYARNWSWANRTNILGWSIVVAIPFVILLVIAIVVSLKRLVTL